jgi:Domain of unknown function (DUF4150)/GHH signature containing HNH/Endo VII superfamily nuclease toxin  2
MANDVFANGREISCKSGAGKSICAFPDVCFTPPENPATPPGVPIPYPNTGMASDTTSGSRRVKISGKEVMLKNRSYFKKSIGDEAGCAAKKGIVTSVNRGKVYFIAWSMDVKAESENVVRHLDLTTHNHASPTANTLFTPHIDELTPEQAAACQAKNKEAADACEGKVPDECDEGCKGAQKCQLVPYNKAGSQCCADSPTGDHIVEASAFHDVGRGGSGSRTLKGCKEYNTNTAPCCCVSGGAYSDEHGRMSALRGLGALACTEGTVTTTSGAKIKKPHVTTYGAAKKRAARALVLTFPQCKEECILAQFDSYDKEHKLKNETEIRATTYGGGESIENRAVKLGNEEALSSMSNALGGAGGR